MECDLNSGVIVGDEAAAGKEIWGGGTLRARAGVVRWCRSCGTRADGCKLKSGKRLGDRRCPAERQTKTHWGRCGSGAGCPAWLAQRRSWLVVLTRTRRHCCARPGKRRRLIPSPVRRHYM